MCRRIVGSGSPSAAILAAFFLFINLIASAAQELPQRITELVERHAEDGGDAEELIRWYETLARRRPSINSLSRRGLEECALFSAFQVESLIEYRSLYGDILSQGELALVDGFNADLAALCAVFLDFSPSGGEGEGRLRHKASLKTRWRFSDKTPSVTAKYSAQKGGSFAAGFTAESDAGEYGGGHPVPDFVSGYISFSGRKVLREFVAGDYSLRAGQGLVCWKAFDLKAFGTPSSMAKQPRGARPYTSSAESGYFRGAAATLGFGMADLTIFVSLAPVDARVVGDTAYTSIATDGYHRTEAELAKRHSMREYAAGAVLTGERGRVRYGLNAIAYRYDKRNGRSVREYNRYQQYEGWWGNLSADIYLFWRNARIFAEAALDAGASPALLAGAVWSPGYSFEASLLCRLYSRSYIATHAGAWSTLSSCSNQRGATLSARWIPGSGWQADANLQYSFYPGPRYGIDGPSSAWKYRLALSRTFGTSVEASLQISGNPAPGWRASILWRPSQKWELKCRYAGNPAGNGAVAECTFSPSAKLRLTAGGAAFSTSGWDSRIYLYQSGVPQSFAVATLYGKGTGAYLLVKYAPVRKAEIWLRMSEKEAAAYLTWSL